MIAKPLFVPMQRTPAAATGRTAAAGPSVWFAARCRSKSAHASRCLAYPFRAIEPICTSPRGDDPTTSMIGGLHPTAKTGGLSPHGAHSAQGGQDPAQARRAGRRHARQVHPVPASDHAKERRRRSVFVDRLRLAEQPRSHQQTGNGRPRLAALVDTKSLPFDGKPMLWAASRRSSRCSAGLIPMLTAHRPGATGAGQPSRYQRSVISWSHRWVDVQDHLASRPAAISASLAMVFMLRAVPAFATGIFSRESAMPSP
jgi:hypothetical protein